MRTDKDTHLKTHLSLASSSAFLTWRSSCSLRLLLASIRSAFLWASFRFRSARSCSSFAFLWASISSSSRFFAFNSCSLSAISFSRSRFACSARASFFWWSFYQLKIWFRSDTLQSACPGLGPVWVESKFTWNCSFWICNKIASCSFLSCCVRASSSAFLWKHFKIWSFKKIHIFLHKNKIIFQ